MIRSGFSTLILSVTSSRPVRRGIRGWLALSGSNALASSDSGPGQPAIKSGAMASSKMAAGGPAGTTRKIRSGIWTARPVESVTSAATATPEQSSGNINIRRRSMTVSLLATVYVVRYSDSKPRGKSRMADRPGPDIELRVMLDGAVAFGPTHAKVLEEILLTGSISAAQ